MTNTGSEGGWGGFWNGSSHLGSHCEERLPFWWRLTWYLLQDHGNSLICSPRVFPLQQWNQQWLVSGQLDNSVLLTPIPGILQKYLEILWLAVYCNTTLKTFPQHYGNEERVRWLKNVHTGQLTVMIFLPIRGNIKEKMCCAIGHSLHSVFV